MWICKLYKYVRSYMDHTHDYIKTLFRLHLLYIGTYICQKKCLRKIQYNPTTILSNNLYTNFPGTQASGALFYSPIAFKNTISYSVWWRVWGCAGASHAWKASRFPKSILKRLTWRSEPITAAVKPGSRINFDDLKSRKRLAASALAKKRSVSAFYLIFFYSWPYLPPARFQSAGAVIKYSVDTFDMHHKSIGSLLLLELYPFSLLPSTMC